MENQKYVMIAQGGRGWNVDVSTFNKRKFKFIVKKTVRTLSQAQKIARELKTKHNAKVMGEYAISPRKKSTVRKPNNMYGAWSNYKPRF